jgi:hypothetical protein
MKKIEEIAETLGKSVNEMVLDLVRIALWIDADKNKGKTTDKIAEAGLDVGVLDARYVVTWEGILFHAIPDRCSHYKGWYVRRTPEPWFEIFVRRYGAEGSAWHKVLEAAHASALAEAESRRVWRKLNQFAGMELEQIDTRTVAYWAAVMDVLGCRAGVQHRALGEMLRAIYTASYRQLRDELRYRTRSDPQKDGVSKKKYLARKADWYKATTYLEAGTNHFFDANYVLHCMMQDGDPDLIVDFEHLPRMTREKTPVRWQRDTDILHTFMQFVGGAALGSFEAEDVQLIVERVRPLLARAKGENV